MSRGAAGRKRGGQPGPAGRGAEGSRAALSLRRILHPSDFSAASRPAFRVAVKLARQNRAELVIAHVLSPVAAMVGDGYLPPSAYEQLQQSAQAQADKQLGALVAAARRAGVTATGVLLDGVASDQIIRAARARRADLIAMGTHGRTGFAKLFLGSVAERVVGGAPCPVLTVRARSRS
jgi:nucleotide-binding universal stress UspA family protein